MTNGIVYNLRINIASSVSGIPQPKNAAMSERARGRSQELSSETSVTDDFEVELEVPAGIWERFGSLAHRRMSDKPVALVVIAVDVDEANEEADHLRCMAALDKRHDAAPFSDIVTQLWP